MSNHVVSKRRDALELIERLLNTTSLTTKRVSHYNVIGVGEEIIKRTTVDVDGEKQQAVEEAVEKAEQRHTRELRGALRRQEHKLNDGRDKALLKQRTHYEELARRVAEQRDKAEEERARQLRRKFEKEKSEALKEQWEECERLKEQAIQEACSALRKQLRNEFAWEKEKAVADALAHAREKFKLREKATIERTKAECAEEFAKVLEGVREEHAEEMQKQQHKYDVLNGKYNKELAHRKRVENDFRELQTDYQRFMDYTEGKYHSDYMMRLRHKGERLAKKKVSVVMYEDIEPLKSPSMTATEWLQH